MQRAPVPYRIIVDSQAAGFVIHDSYKCQNINISSLYYRKKHIVTSMASFEIMKNLLAEKTEENFAKLKATVYPMEDPKLEAISNEVNRIWEYALLISTEPPLQTLIFTDATNGSKYDSLKMAERKTNIQIESMPELIEARLTNLDEFCRRYVPIRRTSSSNIGF